MTQRALFDTAPELPGASLDFYAQIGLDDKDLLQRLIGEIPWRQEDITVFGKTYPQPRLLAWYGDPEASYTYSGILHEPLPWTDLLLEIREAVHAVCATTFNSVLLNYYRDGRDSMGMHADDESELGPEPVIASLSLGEERTLRFRHKRRKTEPGLDLPLPSGSLLVMRGTTQQHWKHGINKLRRPCGPRVNLTFRQVY
ncbi:MAG: alpha-ketoglutarate-dependent dioxygenase AlkB [Pseudomonadota bacterium]